MSCYYPLDGWKSKRLNKNGKREIVFNRKDGYSDMPVKLPCGNCIGCRMQRSQAWAVRCMHEASLHQFNMFLTLTYSDEKLPSGASLNKAHFQDFMKRYRSHVEYEAKKHGLKKPVIRYFHCGEYGKNNSEKRKHRETYKVSNLGRPHYHAIIFGHEFDDQIAMEVQNGNTLYMSPTLEKLWGHGIGRIGKVTMESAAYVARYINKKVTGEAAEDHYTRLDPDTGELDILQAEYTTMSRRPGIGKDWYDKYKNDCYPKDFLTYKGKRIQIPKFYDSILEEEDIELYEKIKAKRRKRAEDNKEDNNLDRLRVKEICKKSQVRQLKRGLEDE